MSAQTLVRSDIALWFGSDMGHRKPSIIRVPTTAQILSRVRLWQTDFTMWREKRAYRGVPREKIQSNAGFVVGCQRSGTDMVLWTLDRSLDVDRFDENHRAAFVSCRIKNKATRQRLIDKSNAKRVIFKPVCDSHRAVRLLNDHADARMIWVYRDFRDVANSAVARWGEMNLEYIRELRDGGGDWGFHQWNRELMAGEKPSELESLYTENLTVYDAAALFWYFVNATFFEQALAGRDDVLLIRYEDLVSSPAVEFPRLCDFLDIGYRKEMIDSVFASSVRRRSKGPIGDHIAQVCLELQGRLDRACEASRGQPDFHLSAP